ncbi:helix-turn-helix domain-containing protein [Nocardia sp. NPDC005745]|uniref:helix-turn-helix domain-containing protein n=1 Tax=Nocardia sp. NPDC005745 TaxID=3157061 RepID=UPI003407F2C3
MYLTNTKAAEMIGIHPVTLARWRCEGRGPRYEKLTASRFGRIRYKDTDVHAWMRQQRRNPEANTEAASA